MNNVTLLRNAKPTVYTGPAGWDELTDEQYLQYARTVDQFGVGMEARIVLLSVWYKISLPALDELTDEQRLQLIDLLAWLDTRPSRWLLPRLTHILRRVNWRGPGDGLEHLTFSEFIYAEAALASWIATEDTTHLTRLVAALYRPYNPAGEGDRAPFQARLLDRQTEAAQWLPSAVLTAVLINYLGVKDTMPTDYPHLFRPAGGSSEGGAGNWLDVGISLARQTSAMGTFAELERTNLHLALTTLDQIMKDQQALEKRLEKHG